MFGDPKFLEGYIKAHRKTPEDEVKDLTLEKHQLRADKQWLMDSIPKAFDRECRISHLENQVASLGRDLLQAEHKATQMKIRGDHQLEQKDMVIKMQRQMMEELRMMTGESRQTA